MVQIFLQVERIVPCRVDLSKRLPFGEGLHFLLLESIANNGLYRLLTLFVVHLAQFNLHLQHLVLEGRLVHLKFT